MRQYEKQSLRQTFNILCIQTIQSLCSLHHFNLFSVNIKLLFNTWNVRLKTSKKLENYRISSYTLPTSYTNKSSFPGRNHANRKFKYRFILRTNFTANSVKYPYDSFSIYCSCYVFDLFFAGNSHAGIISRVVRSHVMLLRSNHCVTITKGQSRRCLRAFNDGLIFYCLQNKPLTS